MDMLFVTTTIVQAVIVVLGVWVTLWPPQPRSAKILLALVITLTVLTIGTSVSQHQRDEKQHGADEAVQSDLRSRLEELGGTAGRIERQTKQPPQVTVNIPPASTKPPTVNIGVDCQLASLPRDSGPDNLVRVAELLPDASHSLIEMSGGDGPNSPMGWPTGPHGGTSLTYRCDLKNFSEVPVFNAVALFPVVYKATITEPSGQFRSGDVVAHANLSVPISTLAQRTGVFSFYMFNLSDKVVLVHPPENMTLSISPGQKPITVKVGGAHDQMMLNPT